MVISGNIQNLGSQLLTSVVIDEITAGDLVITQSSAIADGQIAAGHGTLSLAGLEHDGSAIDFGEVDIDAAVTASTGINRIVWTAITAGSADDFRFIETAGFGGAIVDISGLSTDEDGLEPLAAGSKSFRITVTGISSGTNPNVLDILRTVPASTNLFMTVSGTDGQASTISDPRSVSVRADNHTPFLLFEFPQCGRSPDAHAGAGSREFSLAGVHASSMSGRVVLSHPAVTVAACLKYGRHRCA